MNKIIKILILFGAFMRLDGAPQWVPGFAFADAEVDKSGYLVRDPIVNQFAHYQGSNADLMSKSDLQAFAKQQQEKFNPDGDQQESIGVQSASQSTNQQNGPLEYQLVKSDSELGDKSEKNILFSEFQQFLMKILAFINKK